MDADEFSPRQQLECADRLGGRAGQHREPEFGVLLSGPHEFMSVRLDSRGYPDQDPGPLGACRWAIEQSAQSGDLVKGVDHDAAHPAGQGVGQLLFRLVVAMEDQPVRRHSRREGDVQLTPRRDIKVHALFMSQPGHRLAEEGLGGVGHPLSPGRHRLTAGATQVVLVVDEEGCPELGGQVEQIDIADPQMPVPLNGRSQGQQSSLDRCRGHGDIYRHGRAGYGSPCCPWDWTRTPQTTIVPCSCPRSSADRAPASGAGGAGSSPAGGAL